MEKFDLQKKRGKVAILANTSWYLSNFRASTIDHLSREGWSVRTLAGDNEFAAELKALGAEHFVVPIDLHGINPVRDIRTFLCFIKWLAKERPAIVLNFTPKCNIYGCLAATMLRIPVINNISGVGVGTLAWRPVRLVLHFLYAISSRCASHIFVQNSRDLDYFKRKFGLLDGRVSLLPGSGVDLERFRFSEVKRNPKVRFGMFSRLLEEKGVRIFQEASQKFVNREDVEFVLAGSIEGSRRNAISTEEVGAWQKVDGFRYLGQLSDVKQEMEACDCVVLPSYYPEGTPKSLIEAAAIGRPIITTDHPGCRDTVTPASGYLIPTNSVDDLVGAMRHFLELSFEDRVRMGRAAREHSLNFSDLVVIQKYVQAINDVLRLRRP